MQVDKVDLKIEGNVAVLTLNDPAKMNVLSGDMRRDIQSALQEVDKNDAVRVCVMTGAGKAFCAGADVGEFPMDVQDGREFMASVFDTLRAPETCSKLVIAAVNGVAFGGGLELAIASDFVIASDRARFAVPEIKLGLLPAFGLVRLADIVGRARAKELSILGDPIDAQRTQELGIALRVEPHDMLLDRALEFAGELAARPALSLKMAKSFYNRGLGGDEMRHTLDAFPALIASPDASEGLTAFREGREPQFGR